MPLPKQYPEIINGFKVIKDLGYITNNTSKKPFRVFLVICKKCGKEFEVRPTDLKRINSCLCSRIKNREKNKYLVCKLKSMKARCFNVKNKAYKNYGAKGIVVCEEWKNFTNSFIKWAWENGYQDGLSIERIDNTKGYNPENCKWIEKKYQARNSSKAKLTIEQVKIIKANTKKLSYSELAKLYNVNKTTIASIIKNKTWKDVCI